MQEDHQRHHRQCGPKKNVLGDESDGRVDVVGLIVDLSQVEVLSVQDGLVQPLVHVAQPRHHIENVRPSFAQHAHGNAVGPEPPHDAVRLLEAVAHLGHIGDIDRRTAAHRQQLPLDMFLRAELVQRPHDPAPLPLPEIATRSVAVLAAQNGAHVGDGQLPRGELLGIDDHLQLVLQPADDIGVRDSLDPLERRFDVVFGEPSHPQNIDLRQQRPRFGMLRNHLLQPVDGHSDVVSLQHRIEFRRDVGMLLLELPNLLSRRAARGQHEPRDRLVGRVRRADDRLIGVLGIRADLLEAAVHLQQGLVHVRADGEFELDAPHRVEALGRQLRDPLDAFQLLFLLANDLLLDLLRRGPRPARLDRQRRRLDLGRELHRHRKPGDGAEQHQQQHRHRNFDRVLDEGFNERHSADSTWL